MLSGAFSLLVVAARNVSRYRRRSVITMLAVFFALFPVVVTRGMLNAMNDATRDSMIEGGVGALQVHRRGFLDVVQASPLTLDLPSDDAFLARVRAVPRVRAVTARILFGGLVNANDRSVHALFLGVDPAGEPQVCPQRFLSLGAGDRGVGPGSNVTTLLAARLGAQRGSRVAVLAPDRDGVMNAVEVDIAGIIADPGLLAGERKLGFLPLSLAQELLRMPGRATELAIAVDDLQHVEAVAASLRAVLGHAYQVSTYTELTSFVDETMSKQDVLVSWIANLFLFLALLGIANTMFLSVRERTRDIGTMLAFGMRRAQVAALFLAEAALIACAGGALGALAGSALVQQLGARGIALDAPGSTVVFQLCPSVSPSFVVVNFLVSLLGALVAALLPAVNASRLRPIQALSRPV